MAGKHFGGWGSGANTLCLPKNPEWKNYKAGIDSLTSKIYGVEIDVVHNNQAFGRRVLNRDMSCVVCKTSGHSAVLMVPGKMTCHNGWTKEYSGYLVAQATEYVCVDEYPTSSTSRKNREDNEGVVYPVEIGGCRSLGCPPDVKGRELTCVVCSQ